MLFSSLALALLLWQWRPIPTVVWQIDDPQLAMAVTGISLLGFLIALTSTFLINHFELFGLHQVANNLAGRSMPAPRFRTPLSTTNSCGTRSISASSSRSGRRRR